MNTFGSYVCSCRDGYQEEEHNCYDIDECLFEDVCQGQQECVNTDGGYHCVQNCPVGYRLANNFWTRPYSEKKIKLYFFA